MDAKVATIVFKISELMDMLFLRVSLPRELQEITERLVDSQVMTAFTDYIRDSHLQCTSNKFKVKNESYLSLAKSVGADKMNH